MEVAGQDRKKRANQTLRTPPQKEKNERSSSMLTQRPPSAQQGHAIAIANIPRDISDNQTKRKKNKQTQVFKCSLLLVKDCSIIHSMPVWNKKGHQKRKGQICRSVGWSRLTRASVITGWKLVNLGPCVRAVVSSLPWIHQLRKSRLKTHGWLLNPTGNLWIQRILNPQFSWGVLLLFEVNGYDPDLNKAP